MKSSIHISSRLLILICGLIILLVGTLLVGFFALQKSKAPRQEDELHIVPSDVRTVPEETTQNPYTTEGEEIFVGAGAHLTVHIEPTNSKSEQTTKWETLTRLVTLANEYEMKLSLHFSPQMASYVTQDNTRLALVRGWEQNGHEIGFHHHGLSHPVWDGYSNAPVAKNRLGYIGTMDDLMALVLPLSVDGHIEVGSSTDAQVDWPKEVPYGTNTGAPPSPLDLMSSPQTLQLGKQQVKFLTKAPFAVDHGVENATLEDIALALETTDTYEYLGLTVTDDNLDDADFADLERVFQLYERWGVHTRPIVELLRDAQNSLP